VETLKVFTALDPVPAVSMKRAWRDDNGTARSRIAAAMPAVDSAMRASRKSYVGINYNGAVHGFLRAQDDPKAQRDEAEEQANLAATKDAWPRTLEFLRRNLGAR